jgi:Family of unknown function (DUF6101)
MQKHSSLKRGNDFSAVKKLWPDYAIEVDPYRLPAHIELEVPNPVFSNVAVNRLVSIYSGFVVIADRMGRHAASTRIIALDDFDAVVVRVGFSASGYRRIGSAVYLHHQKLGLDLPLYAEADCRDTAAFWHSWSRVLGLPAMSVDKDGSLIDPYERVGKLPVNEALGRRPSAGSIDFRPAFRHQSAHQKRRMAEASATPRKIGSNIYRLFS